MESMETKKMRSIVKRSIILQLKRMSAVKFKLESGNSSPIEIDLRRLILYPSVLTRIGQQLPMFLPHTTHFDVVCGVSNTAFRVAACVARSKSIPTLMYREEMKGIFLYNRKCLIIIEDLVGSGGSVVETARWLREEYLVVTDAVAFLDREEGGRENLRQNGIKLHSMIKLGDMVEVLKKNGENTSNYSLFDVRHALFFFNLWVTFQYSYILSNGFDSFFDYSHKLFKCSLVLVVIFFVLANAWTTYVVPLLNRYAWTTYVVPLLNRSLPNLKLSGLGWNWKQYFVAALGSILVFLAFGNFSYLFFNPCHGRKEIG